MTHQHPKHPSPHLTSEDGPSVTQRLLTPVAWLASAYISIVAGLLIIGVNRIGRLTSEGVGDVS